MRQTQKLSISTSIFALTLAACSVRAARPTPDAAWQDAGQAWTPVVRATSITPAAVVTQVPRTASVDATVTVTTTAQRSHTVAATAQPSKASAVAHPMPAATPPQRSRTVAATAQPSKGSAVAQPMPTATPGGVPEEMTPAKTEDALRQAGVDAIELPTPAPYTRDSARTEFGIQINGCDKGGATSVNLARQYGFTWIKQQVRWGDMESADGRIDWRCIDDVMASAKTGQMKVLLSVTSAPAHKRMMRNTRGWPDRWEEFGAFLVKLLTRYPKQVDAIEIWNEPNLSAEVDGYKNGSSYAHFLGVAYAVVKSVSPGTMVISGGIAPTPEGNGLDHVEDRKYLSEVLAYDGINRMDCAGAHANGPDGVGELKLVVERYQAILESVRPICVTEFGYALPVEGRAPQGFEWAMPHTQNQQERVLVEGVQHARANKNVALVIVWNLNYDGPPTDVNAPYALTRKGWTSPALAAIKTAITRVP